MIQKKLRIFIYISVPLLIFSLFIFLFLKPTKVVKYKVEKRKMVHSVYASGYIDSSDSVLVKPEVSGYIEKILVTEGQEIKKGQLLAVISNETLKENIREVEAQLASVSERLRTDSDFRKDLTHNIEIKREVLENVEKNYNRRKALFEEGLISKEMFDAIKREYEVAKRDYERQLNIYNDSIKNLSYQFDSLNARKKALKYELEKYYVKSPISGKVLRKFLNEGDYVNNLQQNNVLFSLGSERNLETILLVDEEYIPMVREGMKVLITLDAYPGESFVGSIKTIEKQSDRASRTVKVKANVDYQKSIYFGLTVEANIIIKEVEGLFIPDSAYKNGYVEVLEEGRTKRVKINVSPEKYNGYLLVKDGLQEGQEIILK